MGLFKRKWSDWIDCTITVRNQSYFLIQVKYSLKTNKKVFREEAIGSINFQGAINELRDTVKANNKKPINELIKVQGKLNSYSCSCVYRHQVGFTNLEKCNDCGALHEKE